eukprot:6476112-Pyramimonas_sp.AAC.1
MSSGLWTKRLASDGFVPEWRVGLRGIRGWSIRLHLSLHGKDDTAAASPAGDKVSLKTFLEQGASIISFTDESMQEAFGMHPEV